MRLFPSGQIKMSVPCSTSSARTTPSIFFPLEFFASLRANLTSIAVNQKSVTAERAAIPAYKTVLNGRLLFAILEVAELAFLGHGLGGKDLIAVHFGGHGFAVFIGDLGLVAGKRHRRGVEPDQRPGEVLGCALPVGIERRQIELRAAIALLRRHAKPFYRFLRVFRNALTVIIHRAEIELGAGVSLLAALTVPGGGLLGVLRHATAIGVHQPKRILRIAIAVVGGQPVPARRLLIILGHADPALIHRTEIDL